ncbi:MAG: SsrA-binding protein SmpB [Opitutales bacterium]
MSAKSKKKPRQSEIRNAKVGRNYFIGDKLEAGVALTGTEVKSIRAGRAQISDSFVRFERAGPILYHAHIDEYDFGNRNNHNPTRPRKLLLHKKEIFRLKAAIESGGQALIPTRIYMKGGLVKVEVALCKGKKLYDKREDLKKKTEMREAERALRPYA